MIEEVERLLAKIRLCAEEEAKAAGRNKEEVRIVKSTTLLMARIDAEEGRNETAREKDDD